MSAAHKPGRGFRIAYVLVAVPFILTMLVSMFARDMATGELAPTLAIWCTIGLIVFGVGIIICATGEAIESVRAARYRRLRIIGEALRIGFLAVLAAHTVDLTLNFNNEHWWSLSVPFILLILGYAGFELYVDAKEKKADRIQPMPLQSPPARP